MSELLGGTTAFLERVGLLEMSLGAGPGSRLRGRVVVVVRRMWKRVQGVVGKRRHRGAVAGLWVSPSVADDPDGELYP